MNPVLPDPEAPVMYSWVARSAKGILTICHWCRSGLKYQPRLNVSGIGSSEKRGWSGTAGCTVGEGTGSFCLCPKRRSKNPIHIKEGCILTEGEEKLGNGVSQAAVDDGDMSMEILLLKQIEVSAGQCSKEVR